MVALDDLTDEQRSLLDAIVDGGPDPRRALAWSDVAALELAGHTTATMDELVALRLAVRWALPTMAAITLEPYAAAILGVKILERTSIMGEELEEDPYWAELAKEAPSIHLPRRQHEIRYPWMGEFPDPDTVGPQILEDDEGEPVLILGQTVPIDRRLAKGAKDKAKRRKAG